MQSRPILDSSNTLDFLSRGMPPLSALHGLTIRGAYRIRPMLTKSSMEAKRKWHRGPEQDSCHPFVSHWEPFRAARLKYLLPKMELSGKLSRGSIGLAIASSSLRH